MADFNQVLDLRKDLQDTLDREFAVRDLHNRLVNEIKVLALEVRALDDGDPGVILDEILRIANIYDPIA
jgi:hypothetical protein